MAPIDKIWHGGSKLFKNLKGYYFGHEKEQPPPISARTAFLCAGVFTLLYVAPFYLSPILRSSPLNSRDSPTVIKARVRAVGLSSAASAVITVYILAIYGQATPKDVLGLLGLWSVRLIDCAKVLALVSVLFAGPLYETLIVDGGWRDIRYSSIKENLFDSWIGWRNLVIAPASEELIFRSMVIALSLLAKISPKHIVFYTPLIFGAAHVHHLIDFMKARTPPGRVLPSLPVALQGVMVSLFQFGFTSLFGFFAAFVFLRTGNLYAAILAHSFCNCMGFPRLWGKVGQFAEWHGHHITPDVAQGKRDDSLDGPVRVGNSLMEGLEKNEKGAAHLLSGGPRNLGLGWTVVYYSLIVLGVYGFYKLLWTLTESPHALATI